VDLGVHLAHIERADPADRAALIQRIAALAWREGLNVGADLVQTDPSPINPYSQA
jgi:hypothetical protein